MPTCISWRRSVAVTQWVIDASFTPPSDFGSPLLTICDENNPRNKLLHTRKQLKLSNLAQTGQRNERAEASLLTSVPRASSKAAPVQLTSTRLKRFHIANAACKVGEKLAGHCAPFTQGKPAESLLHLNNYNAAPVAAKTS